MSDLQRHIAKVVACILLIATFPACTAATPSAFTPEPIRVQYSFAAQPWLSVLNKCAGNNIVDAGLSPADFQDLQSTDMVMRLGKPDIPAPHTYQIGAEDILVIVNSKNQVSQLTANQVRQLFTGQIQAWQGFNGNASPVDVWVFPSGEDVQQIFQQVALGGSPVASTARLAASPTEMLQAIEKNVNAIGIITRRWTNGEVTEAFTVARGLPVLALTQSDQTAALAQILACMQK